MTTEYKRMQQLRGTTADWIDDNIVPLDGELAVERAGEGARVKLGDGSTPWSALPYLIPAPAMTALGSINATTTAPPAGAVAGDFWVNTGTGTVVAGWAAPAAGLATVPGDQLLFDADGQWNLIPFGTGYVRETDLAGPDGSDLVGWQQDGAGAVPRTVEGKLKEIVTPQDFGATAASANHTAAFVALAAQYALGRAVRIPDLGYPYLVDPDQVIFTPPASYNADYRRPPTIGMDESAIIRLRTQGATGNFLVQFGTPASNYSGILRCPDFKLGEFDANAGNFAKGVLYFPFFLDMRLDARVANFLGKGIQYGDAAAPAASAGIKGRRDYDRDLYLWRRDSVTITNAVNPVITFPTANPLWPSTGRRCVGVNFVGAPAGWNAIAARSLDALILSPTTVQLLNVDSSGFGAFTGTAIVNLCLPSMRVSKKISGVTNANPCVITTAVPHLLTSGQTVDVAEIGNMQPDAIRAITGVHGQFVATVISPTTFSIPLNTTSIATYGQYSAGLGPGLVMEWLPLAQCDIAEFRANATDADDSELYVRHVRIGVYADPNLAGWDGKGTQPHFYSFPETAELLCAYYVGGHNNFVQVQCDGPLRYVFWAVRDGNASSHSSTNCGSIDPRDIYGVLVRTEALGGWSSHQDRLVGRAGARMFTDHVGSGKFSCVDPIYDQVYSPTIEYGSGKRAAAVVFDGSALTIKAGIGVTGATVTRVPGGDLTGDWYVDMYRPVPLDAYVEIGSVSAPDCVVNEDFGWAGRSLFQRRIRNRTAGVAADINRVSVTWRYP